VLLLLRLMSSASSRALLMRPVLLLR